MSHKASYDRSHSGLVHGIISTKMSLRLSSDALIAENPPDKQEKATRTVLEQAEMLSEMWASA